MGWISLDWLKGREGLRKSCTAEKDCDCDRCLLESNDPLRLELLVYRRIAIGGWRSEASPLTMYSELPRVLNYPDPAQAFRAVMSACINMQHIGFAEVIAFLLSERQWDLVFAAIEQAAQRPVMVFKNEIISEKFWKPYKVRVYDNKEDDEGTMITDVALKSIIEAGKGGLILELNPTMHEWALEYPEFVKEHVEKGTLVIDKMDKFVIGVLKTCDPAIVEEFLDLVKKSISTYILATLQLDFEPSVEYLQWLSELLPIDGEEGEKDVEWTGTCCCNKVVVNRRQMMDILIMSAKFRDDFVIQAKYYVEHFGAYPSQRFLDHFPEVAEALNTRIAKNDRWAKTNAIRDWLLSLGDGGKHDDRLDNYALSVDEFVETLSDVVNNEQTMIGGEAHRFGTELLKKLRADVDEEAISPTTEETESNAQL